MLTARGGPRVEGHGTINYPGQLNIKLLIRLCPDLYIIFKAEICMYLHIYSGRIIC